MINWTPFEYGRALCRGASAGEDERIEFSGLLLDTAGYRLSAEGREIHMGPTEYRLLPFLMTHADRAFSRDRILDRAWGVNVYVEDRTVDVWAGPTAP